MSGRGPAGRSSGGGRGGRGGRGRGGRRGGRGRGRNNNNKRSSGRGGGGGGGTVPMDVENNNTTTTIPASGFDNSSMSNMQQQQQQKPSQQLQQNQKQPATMQTTTNSCGDNEKKQLAHITNHKFAELQISAESRRALSTVFKYEYMTTVQAETLPLILNEGGNKDCLAKAKTGTGASLLLCVLLLIFYNMGSAFSISSLTTISNTPISRM